MPASKRLCYFYPQSEAIASDGKFKHGELDRFLFKKNMKNFNKNEILNGGKTEKGAGHVFFKVPIWRAVPALFAPKAPPMNDFLLSAFPLSPVRFPR
jgi:hypothetical protein